MSKNFDLQIKPSGERVKRFSKNYGNKGINYLQSESYIKMPASLMLHPYITAYSTIINIILS